MSKTRTNSSQRMNSFSARVAHLLPRGAKAKRLALWFGVAIVVGAFFFLPKASGAAGLLGGAGDAIAGVISWFIYIFIYQLGKLTVALFGILVQVAQYNDFINAPAVEIGWRVLRDISNMLFVLVLLVIAFGTAFRMQSYRYNTMLRQLIIMAVLINFSKLITGFFIDFAQVIMLTFVNAFADTAAGNLTTALHLDKLLAINTSLSGDQVTSISVAGTLILGLIMIAATTIVTFLYVIIFLGRIVFLWILTILSPVAYLLSTFPSTKSYWSKWWKMFWQYAMVGPVLAFFLWLTLTVTAAGNAVLIKTNLTNQSSFESSGAVTAAISEIGSQAGILSFLVAIMLLVFSLKTASDFSVAGGSWAQSAGRSASKNLVGFTGAIAGAGYRSTLQRPVEWVAGKATQGLARAPLLASTGERLNARFNQYKKARKERHEKTMGSVDDNILAARANSFGWSPEGQSKRDVARKLKPGSIKDEKVLKKVLDSMVPGDLRSIKDTRLLELANALPKDAKGKPKHITELYPDLARAVVQGGTKGQKTALGLTDVEWIRPTRARGTTPAQPGGFTHPKGKMPDPAKPLPDIDQSKFAATERAIRLQHGGDAAAFFASPQFGLAKDNYVDQTDYDAAMRIRRAETKLSELTGVNSAKRKAAAGGPVDLAMDFAEGEALGLVLGGAAGANITGAQQKIAAGVLSEKYRHQEEDKEAEHRYQGYKDQDAAAGYSHDEDELQAERRRTQAERDVQADRAFQQRLGTETNDFRTSLENAESIRLINKGRTGRSARQVLRHEQAHDVVEGLDNESIQEMWDQLDAKRQDEIEKYIRSTWANGDTMSLQNVQKEFFTEAYASHGHEQQIGPLGFGPNEEGVAGHLFAAGESNRYERSRLEVDKLPADALTQLYTSLPSDRRAAIGEYVRSEREGGKDFSDDDVMREFFSQALASHRGAEKEGPLAFSEDEQEMALLLHSSAQGKAPSYTKRPATVAPAPAPSAPVSVAEVSKRVPPPPTVPAPSGAGRVIATPPVRIVERQLEAPVSPVVYTNVIQNTTVKSVADDLSRKISGRIDDMPSRQDLHYAVQQLESAVTQVVKREKIADSEIQGLLAEMSALKADVRSPSQRPDDQRALQQNLQRFLKKFRNAEVDLEPGDTEGGA